MQENQFTQPHPSMKSYIAGFVLSLFCTVCAFALVYAHIGSGHALLPHGLLFRAIIVLALMQFFAQAVFFLHLSLRKNSHTRLVTFVFTTFIVAFIVIGSLWIMQHLHANMMPQEMEAYLHHEN